MTRIITVSVILTLLLLAYWTHTKRRVDVVATISAKLTPCPDEVDKVVLQIVMGRFQGRDYNYLSVWISQDYSMERWSPLLEDEQQEINRIHEWAKSLTDSCTRKAYEGWLDYYQKNLDSAYTELKTQAAKRNMDAFDAENENSKRKISNFQEKNHIPQPPDRR